MQSRKFLSAVLAILLLVSNSGFAFSVHYCGGKIAAISTGFNTEEVCDMPVLDDKACCSKPTNDHKSCCEDKTVDLEKSDDVVVKVYSFEIAAPFAIPVWQSVHFTNPCSISDTKEAAYFFEPHSPPLFRLYNQYIFYA